MAIAAERVAGNAAGKSATSAAGKIAGRRSPCDPLDADQFVYLRDISWEGFESFLALRGESSATRITYVDGTLEIMAPSQHHEIRKKKLARLVEAWADAVEQDLDGIGSWTLKNALAKRGVEPDECYVVGAFHEDMKRPDFVIEVVWTSGGIDKLDVYRVLGVPEVWIFEDERLTFHRLVDGDYQAEARSTLLPALDPALLAECMAIDRQREASRHLRARLAEASDSA